MESDKSNAAATPQEVAATPGFKITIVDQTGMEMRLGIVQCELITELRDILLENVNTCCFNYYFEHKGERLDEFAELRSVDLSEDDKFYLREDKYNERTARQHLRRTQEILFDPPVLNNIQTEINDQKTSLPEGPPADESLPKEEAVEEKKEMSEEEKKAVVDKAAEERKE